MSKKAALLIDIRYDNNAAAQRSETLQTSTTRMQTVITMLQTNLNFPTVRLATDYPHPAKHYPDTTRQTLLEALTWLGQGSGPGDHLLLMVLAATDRRADTNVVLPSDWQQNGDHVVPADAIILGTVMPLHPQATLTIWLDSNHPQNPINQLQYMFYSLAEPPPPPASHTTSSRINNHNHVHDVVETEFSNVWYLRDDKSPVPLPRNIVMFASVLEGATPQESRNRIGTMTDIWINLLNNYAFKVRNRTMVKLLHVACNLLHAQPFRPVMSLSHRPLFDKWFLDSLPQSVSQSVSQ
jgi:hypothetical protein